MYSCNALVICIGLLCLPSTINMSEFVDVIATEDGRIPGSRIKFFSRNVQRLAGQIRLVRVSC